MAVEASALAGASPPSPPLPQLPGGSDFGDETTPRAGTPVAAAAAAAAGGSGDDDRITASAAQTRAGSPTATALGADAVFSPLGNLIAPIKAAISGSGGGAADFPESLAHVTCVNKVLQKRIDTVIVNEDVKKDLRGRITDIYNKAVELETAATAEKVGAAISGVDDALGGDFTAFDALVLNGVIKTLVPIEDRSIERVAFAIFRGDRGAEPGLKDFHYAQDAHVAGKDFIEFFTRVVHGKLCTERLETAQDAVDARRYKDPNARAASLVRTIMRFVIATAFESYAKHTEKRLVELAEREERASEGRTLPGRPGGPLVIGDAAAPTSHATMGETQHKALVARGVVGGTWRQPSAPLAALPNPAAVIETIRARALSAYAPTPPAVRDAYGDGGGASARLGGIDMAMQRTFVATAATDRELVASRVRQYTRKCEQVLREQDVENRVETASKALRDAVAKVVAAERQQRYKTEAVAAAAAEAVRVSLDKAATARARLDVARAAALEAKVPPALLPDDDDDSKSSGATVAINGATEEEITRAGLALGAFEAARAEHKRLADLSKLDRDKLTAARDTATHAAKTGVEALAATQTARDAYNAAIDGVCTDVRQDLMAWVRATSFASLSDNSTKITNAEVEGLRSRAWVGVV